VLLARAWSGIATHIFVDETGSFGGIGQFPSVSLIGALIVPDERLAKLEKSYRKIRANLPKDDKGEVKGRLLNEQQVNSVVPLLLHHSALFEAVAIDLGVHSEEGLKTFQAQQAEKMTANLTGEHKQSLKDQVWQARGTFENFKLPLMVQAILTFELVAKVIEDGTMYYSTRRPVELGKFNWVIDAKGTMDTPTEWEEWWSKFLLPALQTRSFGKPFKHLPLGDYSHLARFETEADPFIRKMSNWQEGDPAPLDLGTIMRESFTFANVATPGLELVDIVTNSTRRAINGNLQKQGWARIPELMIHRTRQHYISMISLQDFQPPAGGYPYWPVIAAYSRGGRLMMPAHLRNKKF
jgi:hypothetical protein